jgi:hypothetical protein
MSSIHIPFLPIILDPLIQRLAFSIFTPSFLLFCLLRPSGSHYVSHEVRFLPFLPCSSLPSITKGQQAPTLTYDSSRGTLDLNPLCCLTLDCVGQPWFLLYAFSPSLCRLSFLCLVPSFNCTWYLDPFPTIFTESYEADGCHSTTSTDSHSLILPSSLPSMFSVAQLLVL